MNKYVSLLIRKKRRRGQVFIMACLVIGVYIISLLTSISAISTELARKNDDESELVKYLSEIKRETKNKLISYLRYNSQANNNNTILTTLRNDFEEYLGLLGFYAGTKGIVATLETNPSSLQIIGKQINDIANVVGDDSYFVSATVNISYSLNNMQNNIHLNGEIYIIVKFDVELTNLRVIVTEKTIAEEITDYPDDAIITLDDGSNLVYANTLNNGTYIFPNSQANSYINVTLSNGIRIYS